MNNHDIPGHRYPETSQVRSVAEIQVIKVKTVKGGFIKGYRFHYFALGDHEDTINGLHLRRRWTVTFKPEGSRQAMRDAAMHMGLPGNMPSWPCKARCARHTYNIMVSEMLKQPRGKIIGQDFNVVMGEDKRVARALREAAIIPLRQGFCITDKDDFMCVPSQKLAIVGLNAR
jgi:hypothetical protein